MMAWLIFCRVIWDLFNIMEPEAEDRILYYMAYELPIGPFIIFMFI